jgi:hypothetical protein
MFLSYVLVGRSDLNSSQYLCWKHCMCLIPQAVCTAGSCFFLYVWVLGQPLCIISLLRDIIRDILENAVIPCPTQGLGQCTWYLGQNCTAQTSQGNNRVTWKWTLMASHIAKKYKHFWTCSIHTVFEQLILPASIVVEWVTDHIHPQVLIFHLLVIPPQK